MTISGKEIYKIALAVKTYVEKNKKFPLSIKVNGKLYTYGQVAYILATAINDLKTPVKIFKVNYAKKPIGNHIYENILENDYKDIAKRVSKFILENKQCPNYAKTKKTRKKLHPYVFIYMFARIIVFYGNKRTLPNYANVNSAYYSKNESKTSKLKPYLSSQGCSGMGQCTEYYCACNSLQQSFYRLTGIQVAESTIAGVAGTTTSGTGHSGIETAVAWFNKKYNQNIKITWKNFSDLGNTDTSRWKALQNAIDNGAVFCHLLYRDQYGHYEVPKDVSSDNTSIINSLGDSCGGESFCGYIESRSRSTQLRYISGISQKSIAILTKG